MARLGGRFGGRLCGRFHDVVAGDGLPRLRARLTATAAAGFSLRQTHLLTAALGATAGLSAGMGARLQAALLASASLAALVGGVSSAKTLAAGEAQALAFDFTDDFFQASTGQCGSAYILDTGTPANDYDSHPYGLLTYTSPSAKMTMGPDGTLRFGAHNRCLYSEQFDNANWTARLCAVTANTTAAPDGTTTAETVTISAGNGYRDVYGNSITSVAGTYTLSLRVKAGTGAWFAIGGGFGATTDGAFFNAATGAVGTVAAGVTASMTDLGSGWYLASISGTWGTGAFLPTFEPHSADNQSINWNSPAGGETFYIWGFHFRRTPSDSTYLATTSAARYALPYEWSSAGVLQGILVEEARTNLCLQSSDLTNAAWIKTTLTTAKTATGPDGVANSATTCTATLGNAMVLQTLTSGSAARITSVWLKRRTGTGNVDLTQDNGSTWTTQAITSSWARYNLASVTSANPILGLRIVTSGDAVDVALFQHEVGSFITSAIPTLAATVTRASDNISLATSAFPHSATVNSAMVRYQPINVAAAMIPLRWNDGTANEVVSLGHSASAVLGLTVTDGGAAQTAPLTDGTATAAAWEKIACSFKANDFLFSDNGATAVADTSGTLPTVTTLQLGPTLSGYISHILVVPAEKDATEVAAMAA